MGIAFLVTDLNRLIITSASASCFISLNVLAL